MIPGVGTTGCCGKRTRGAMFFLHKQFSLFSKKNKFYNKFLKHFRFFKKSQKIYNLQTSFLLKKMSVQNVKKLRFTKEMPLYKSIEWELFYFFSESCLPPKDHRRFSHRYFFEKSKKMIFVLKKHCLEIEAILRTTALFIEKHKYCTIQVGENIFDVFFPVDLSMHLEEQISVRKGAFSGCFRAKSRSKIVDNVMIDKKDFSSIHIFVSVELSYTSFLQFDDPASKEIHLVECAKLLCYSSLADNSLSHRQWNFTTQYRVSSVFREFYFNWRSCFKINCVEGL